MRPGPFLCLGAVRPPGAGLSELIEGGEAVRFDLLPMGSFVRGFLGGRPRIIPYCDGSDMLVHSSGPLLEGFSRLRNVKERFMVLDHFLGLRGIAGGGIGGVLFWTIVKRSRSAVDILVLGH